MTRQQSLQSFNLQALAASGEPLADITELLKLERLAQESKGLQPGSMVNWQVEAELRVGSTGQQDTWLHLQANTAVPMTCQRCMGAMQTPLVIDQWYRFVATEEIAMAEDDASEEDLLVMTPQFDLLALLEDELLMALPLVPMHEVCPVAPVLSAGDLGGDLDDEVKPHPFAALAQLKKK
jgi:uncharacterized protein